MSDGERELRFSQRIGVSPVSNALQREGIDDRLRNQLWNVISMCVWDTYREPTQIPFERNDRVHRSNLDSLVNQIWHLHLARPLDTIPTYWQECRAEIRDYFFGATWYEVYDFLEFVANSGSTPIPRLLALTSNKILESCDSAYRFVDNRIVEITSEVEIEEIETALARATPFGGAKAHLETALELLSSRPSPDFRNSIKESISAVEALVKQITASESGTLGVLLKKLEGERRLHPDMAAAFTKLYHYTSDADGIRHGFRADQQDPTRADARFMLVCCSAFVNYVIDSIAT